MVCSPHQTQSRSGFPPLDESHLFLHIADFPVPPYLDAFKCSDVAPTPELQHQVKNLLHPKHPKQLKIPKQESKPQALEVKREEAGCGQTLSLNTLLFVYLFL